MCKCNEQKYREMKPQGECQGLGTQTRKGEALKSGTLDPGNRVAATGSIAIQGLSSSGEHRWGLTEGTQIFLGPWWSALGPAWRRYTGIGGGWLCLWKTLMLMGSSWKGLGRWGSGHSGCVNRGLRFLLQGTPSVNQPWVMARKEAHFFSFFFGHAVWLVGS